MNMFSIVRSVPLPLAALIALATAASPQHCETVLVTLNGEGAQGIAGFGSTRPAVSAGFGDGLVCANGTVIRLGTRPAVSRTSRYPGPSDQPVSVHGQIPSGGAVRTYQIWYRIAITYGTPATYSFSNAYQIAWSI